MKRTEMQILGTLALLLALGCADEGEEAASAEVEAMGEPEALAGPEAIEENPGDGEPLPGDSSAPSEPGAEESEEEADAFDAGGESPLDGTPGEREESPRQDETPDGSSPEVDVPGEDEEDSSVTESDAEGMDASADSLAEDSDSGSEDSDGGGSADGLESDGGSEGDSEEPPAEPGPNLIQNPGFEDGADFWGIWGGAQRVEGNAHEGNWAIRATNGNGAEQVVTGLEPNATYRLRGWGKVDGPEPMLVGVKNYGGNQKAIPFKTSEYEEGTLTFNTGFSNTSAVVFAYKHTGGEAGHADTISLHLESLNAKGPVWSDEFNGEGPLDPTKWTFEKGFVRNQEIQWYQSENAFQEGGHLVIEGRTEDKPNPGYDPEGSTWQSQIETIEYSSASVISKGLYTFQYGTLVVRAKVTNLEGTWPAIWTLGTECKWPSRGEVDVMENYGGNILANFAWGTDTPWTPIWDSSTWPVVDFGEGWVDEFHIWELQWTPESMRILLDGAVLNEVSLSDTVNGSWECAGENPFQQPHYILLNLALGSNGGSVENLVFPTRYQVDYVRVYE